MTKILKSIKNKEGKRIERSEELFNLTHLSPGKEMLRYRLQHRDFIAHAFRWVYTCKLLQQINGLGTAKVLDVGCGPEMPQLVALHSNGAAPALYVGIDAREPTIVPRVNFETAFAQHDVTKPFPPSPEGGWDVVVCYELIEHMSKESGQALLNNIAASMTDSTVLLLSTPCYSESMGMAENHVYEWGYSELKEELETRFEVVEHFGTFASQRDYKDSMTAGQAEVFEQLKKYYNSAMIACIMAPMFPDKSRNCLWQLKLKN